MNKHRRGRGGHQALPKYPLTNQLDYIKNSILPILIKDFNSQPFLRPVDYKKLKIRDYPKIILHAMDLGTIKSRVIKGCYSTAKECIADVNSVFHNCFIYNTPDFDFYKKAQNLSKIFNSLLKDMPSEEYCLENQIDSHTHLLPSDTASPASCSSSLARDLPASSDTVAPVVSGASTTESSDLPTSLGSDSTTSIPLSLSLKRKVSDQTNCIPSVSDNAFISTDVDMSQNDQLMAQTTGKMSQCDTPVSVSEMENIQQRTLAQLITPSPDYVEPPLAKRIRKETMTIDINDIKSCSLEDMRKRMEAEEQKDFSSCFRILDVLTSKKHSRLNRYFLEPVDVTKAELSDYYEKIIMPMDFGSIRKKLNANNYEDQSQFETDVNLIFENCYQYNGQKHFVSNAARKLKSVFDSLLDEERFREMSQPDPNDEKLSDVRSAHSPESTSQSYPIPNSACRNADIPPDLINCSSSPPSLSTFTEFVADDCSGASTMDFCHQILKKLHSSKYRTLAFPFLKPVDVDGLGLDQYYDIIKKPMDLQTVRHNLESNKYQSYLEFADDIRLIFDNCVTYNGKDHEVSIKGKKLQKHFESLLVKHLKSLKLTSISSTVNKNLSRVSGRTSLSSSPFKEAPPAIIADSPNTTQQSNSRNMETRPNQSFSLESNPTAVPLNEADGSNSDRSDSTRLKRISTNEEESCPHFVSCPSPPPDVDIDAGSEATRVCDNAFTPPSSRLEQSSPSSNLDVLQIFISSAQTLKSLFEKQNMVIDTLEKLSAEFRQFASQSNLPESSVDLLPDRKKLTDESGPDNASDKIRKDVHETGFSESQSTLTSPPQEKAPTEPYPRRRSSAATAIKRIHELPNVSGHSSFNDQRVPNLYFSIPAEEKLTSLKKHGLSVDDLSIAQTEKLITLILHLEREYENSLTLATFRFTLPLLKESTFTELDTLIDRMLTARNCDESVKKTPPPSPEKDSKRPRRRESESTRSPKKTASNTNLKKAENATSLPPPAPIISTIEQNIEKPQTNSHKFSELANKQPSPTSTSPVICETIGSHFGANGLLVNGSNNESSMIAPSCNEPIEDKQLDDQIVDNDKIDPKKSKENVTNRAIETSEDESDSEDSPVKKKKPLWGIPRKRSNAFGKEKSSSNSSMTNSQTDLEHQKKVKEEAKRLIENETKRACQLSQKEEQNRLAKEQAEKEECERKKEQAKQEEIQREERERQKELEKKEEIQKRKLEDARIRAEDKFEPEPLNLHEILCDFENRIDPEIFDQFRI